MGNISGILNQATAAGNSKASAIYFDVKNITGAILTPKGYQISNTNLATVSAMLTALQVDCNNASKAARLFALYGFEQISDNSEDIQVQTTSIGSRKPVRDGYNDWGFEFFTGGLSLLNQLRKFNKQSDSHDFFFIDAGGRLIGMQATDSNGNIIMQAIPSQGGFFWAHPFKMNDGSKLAQYKLQFVFNPKYINELVNYVDLNGVDLATTLYSLEDVNLTGVADATSGTYDIVPQTPTGIYLAANYGTALAQAGAWIATNATTGLVIAITGVTAKGDGQTMLVALNKSDANYPASGKVNITLAAPAALAALSTPLTGFESTGPVGITKN